MFARLGNGFKKFVGIKNGADDLSGLKVAIQAFEKGDTSGSKWEVVIIEAGTSKTDDHFPTKTLEAAIPLFEGSQAFALSKGQHVESSMDKPVGDIVGWYDNVRLEGSKLVATLNLIESADWLKVMLSDLNEKGKLGLLGISIDIEGIAENKQIDGKEVRYWSQFAKINGGGDIVWDPAAGGAITKALQANGNENENTEETKMKDKLLELVKKLLPDLFKEIDPENITEDALLELLAKAKAAPAKEAEEGEGESAQESAAGEAEGAESGDGVAAKAEGEGETEAQQALKAQLDRLLQADARNRLKTALDESRLPELTQAKIKARFKGQDFKDSVLQQAITSEREYLGKLTQSGKVIDMGGTSISVEGEPERLQMSLHKMLGVTGDDVKKSDAPAFTSIRQAYVKLTADADVRGLAPRGTQKLKQIITSAGFGDMLGNTLYRRLTQDYAEQDYGERNIISVGSAPDFRTRENVRIGYFGDIATVDPEAADYQEITAMTDEKVTYGVTTRGNLLTVTRKTIINDDLRGVEKMVGRLGRAARRTFARFIWNFWINNSTYGVDALAWFVAGHTNLRTAALSTAEIEQHMILLANMTEMDSGETLGLNFSQGFSSLGLWLVVPSALFGLARQENERETIDANNTPNPVRHAFGANSERIIVNPLLTDANDWGIFRDARDIESIVVDFLGGQETPELFLADQPTVGQMFVADKLQYKIRHEYGGAIADYRGATKAVVA